MSKNIIVAIFVVALIVIVLAISVPREARSQTTVLAVVKLYSGGTLAQKWNAISIGKIEGETYVFKVASGVREQEVRIRGTYSVETIPQQ